MKKTRTDEAAIRLRRKYGCSIFAFMPTSISHSGERLNYGNRPRTPIPVRFRPHAPRAPRNCANGKGRLMGDLCFACCGGRKCPTKTVGTYRSRMTKHFAPSLRKTLSHATPPRLFSLRSNMPPAFDSGRKAFKCFPPPQQVMRKPGFRRASLLVARVGTVPVPIGSYKVFRRPSFPLSRWGPVWVAFQ